VRSQSGQDASLGTPVNSDDDPSPGYGKGCNSGPRRIIPATEAGGPGPGLHTTHREGVPQDTLAFGGLGLQDPSKSQITPEIRPRVP